MSRAVALSFYTIITGFPVLTFKTASVSLHLEASLPLPRNHSINGVEFPQSLKQKCQTAAGKASAWSCSDPVGRVL